MKTVLLMTLCSLSLSSLAQEDLHSLAQLKTEQRATTFLHLVHAKTALLNPQLAAVSALNPAAAQDAAKADQEQSPQALHGLPMMVKDNIAIKGMATTAGSLTLADNVATEDAFIVAKLRAAGMILVGKTNLSEWANFRSTKSTSGWSSAGGQTRNPYNPKMSPCGSSSGSGAAVAARMIPAAIGTETDGSIVCPAAVNGVVGFKPTLGLVSRTGIVPLSHSQDTAGPINYKKGDIVSGSASSPAAIAGYPHLTVPMGLVRGLPVGISFFAGAWSDAQLLNMGYAFEQARPALPAPKLLKKIAR